MEYLYDKSWNKKGPLFVMIVGVVTALWLWFNDSRMNLSLFIICAAVFMPLLVATWHKLKLFLQFNDSTIYRRFIYLKGTVQFVLLIGVMSMLALYSLKYITLDTMSLGGAVLIAGCLLLESWVDWKVLKIDDEHVVESLLGLMNREKRKE
jgi:small-conductance mechanosensitive channel